VITTPVLEGLPAAAVPACRVADTPETFAGEILRQLDLTPEDRRASAARADVQAFDWGATLSGLEAIIRAAGQGAHQAEDVRRR
jgi:hypothetical protein